MSAGHGDTAGDEPVMPLHSHRLRYRLVLQKIQHATPTVDLLSAAFQSRRDDIAGINAALTP